MPPFRLILRGCVGKFNDGHHSFLSTQHSIHDMRYKMPDKVLGYAIRDSGYLIREAINEK